MRKAEQNCPARKGDRTREAILERALRLASRVGLEGLTIGTLAEELGLSKSGLFAHFKSKETLLVETLELAARRFTDAVVKPALAAPRGEPRVRALFERFLRWPEIVPQPGGCVFVAAAIELDDRPGPARDKLVSLRAAWLETVAEAVRRAVAEGHFRSDVDAEQFAFEMDGIGLMWHHATRLLGDSKADERAHRAFESLVAASRAQRS